MATRSEIEGLIWNIQEKIERYLQTIDDCNKKIARLKPVYRKLGDIKSCFRSARKSTAEIFEEKGTWRGEKHTSFCNDGIVLDNSYGEYYNRLDAAQDAVNSKIGELESKIHELDPLVGKLKAQITQLWIDFQNAVN